MIIGLFLLLIAIAFVALLLIFSQRPSDKSRYLKFHKGYLTGLNFLLNEEPDKAVDVFIELLEIDANTIDTHLALGKLFRRRGEADRAIKIHQNVLAKPNLGLSDKKLALIALGRDFLAAGVLDRAEKVFQEVVTLDQWSEEGLAYLLEIYQQEKQWDKAIEIAETLAKIKNQAMHEIVAHYYCEISQFYLDNKDYERSLLFLKRAIAQDKQCVRAELALANLYSAQGSYKLAIKSLKKVYAKNPEFLYEILTTLSFCYEQSGDEKGLAEFVESCLVDNPQTSLYLFLYDYMQKTGANKISKQRLHEHVLKYPSIVGLNTFVKLVEKEGAWPGDDATTILSSLEKIISSLPRYKCNECGLAGKMLYWQCPRCKSWGETKPVYALNERG